MKKFNSITDFENFVEQTRSEYLEKTKETFPYDSRMNRFLIQLNTDLKDRGFEILNSDPVTANSDARTQIKIRLTKAITSPYSFGDYDSVVQKHIDDIEKDEK